ncbi:MAG: hypothetical protein CM15mP46_6950 [Alphaproteobacteria bacterium]|nr:MAG: hypothetical protein CM15mP46_6950 [Alphaproteobacteria bacterium]
MSKSDPSDYARINMTDDADMIPRKLKTQKPMGCIAGSEKAGFLVWEARGRNPRGFMPPFGRPFILICFPGFGGGAEFKTALGLFFQWRNCPHGAKKA